MYLVGTRALARVLGVSPPAIRKAAAEGKIAAERDRWDVFAVLLAWRASTHPTLQRDPGDDRPWLNRHRPLTAALVREVVERACAELRTAAGARPTGVEALCDEIARETAAAERWDLGIYGDDHHADGYPFTVAEVRAALAVVPHARAWLLHAYLESGDWADPFSDDEFPEGRPARARRMVESAVWWIVALHRRAARSIGVVV